MRKRNAGSHSAHRAGERQSATAGMGHCKHRRRHSKSVPRRPSARRTPHHESVDRRRRVDRCRCRAVGAGCAHTPRGHVEARRAPIASAPATSAIASARSPTGWRLVHQEGASVGFYNERSAASSRPTPPAATTPRRRRSSSADAAAAHRLHRSAASSRRRRCRSTAREALRTRVDAKLDGVPMTLDLYVLKRNGCIFDLSYAAPPDAIRARQRRLRALRRRLRRRAAA